MLRTALKILAIIIVLFFSTIIFLYWQTNVISNLIRNTANSQLEGIAEIHFSELSGNLYETIEFSDLQVVLEDSSRINTKSLIINYNISSLIFNPIAIEDIMFDSLTVDLKLQPPEEKEIDTQKFTVDDIPAILDSLINVNNLFSIFPELIIKKLEIINGIVVIPEYELHLDNVNLNADYMFTQNHLQFNLRNLTGKWIEKEIELKKFQLQLDATKQRVTLNQCQLLVNDSFVFLKSEINYEEKTWIIFDLENAHIQYSDLRRFMEIKDVESGWVNSSIKIVGSPDNFSAQVQGKGITENYQLDTIIVDLDYKDKTIYVREGKVLVNNSLLTFSGNGSRKATSGKIKYKKFNISNLIPNTIETSLTGNLTFNIDDLNINHITGSVDLLLHDSVIDSVKIDSIKFALLAVDNNFDIIEPSILRFSDSSLFSVRGNLNRSMELQAELSTTNNNLSQLFTALNFDSVNGKFDANLTMFGDVENPDLQGYLFLPNVLKDSIQLDTILMDLQLDKIFTRRNGVAHFSVLKGDIYGFELTEALVNLSFDSNRVVFDTLRFANNENYISIAGQAVQNGDSINLGLNQVKVNYQNYWIENVDSLLVDFYPNEFVIDQAIFKAPGDGIIECRGFWDNEIKDLQLGVYVENIQIDPFRQFADSSTFFGGEVNGEIHIIDPLTDIDIESEVTGEGISFNQSSMGNVSMDIEYDNGSIYFKEFNLDNGVTQFNADGDIALKFIEEDGKQKIDFIEGTETNLSVNWENVDLNQYQQMLNLNSNLAGMSSGQLNFTGNLKQPEINIDLSADSIQYEKYELKDLKLSSHYKDGFIILDSLKSEINETFVSLNGQQKLDLDLTDLNFDLENSPFEFELYSKDNRIDFLGNFLDQIEKLIGNYETNIHIHGTPAKMIIDTGYFKIDNGELVLSRVKDPVTDLSADIVIQDSVLNINNLTGYSIKEKDLWEEAWGYLTSFVRLFKGDIQPEGELNGAGTISLKDITHPEIDLNLNLYDFYVDYFIENTELLISSENLKIQGRDTINLTGEIIIGAGKYTVDLDKMRKKIYLSSTEIKKGRTISWNLNITIPENFIIASSPLDLVNNFEMEISGDLQAIQEPYSKDMGLTGHVDILSGNYVAFGQRFEIRQGSIDFSNPKKINPEIEIYAQKETGDYTVELAINGNLERLQQDLQIRDANGIYLTNLSLYDKLGYLSGSGEGSELVNTGQDVINTSVETAIERGAQSVTGLDKVEIKDSKGVIDLQSMKLNNGLQDASISIGKYLTNNLYLEYRSRLGAGMIPAPKLSWEAGNQLSLAYKINRNWSVESAYAQTLRGNTLINISLGWKTSF